MQKKKEQIKFIVSVEGETEKWYFDWLQRCINSANPDYQVIIKPFVEKNPTSFSKKITVFQDESLFHVCDIEGKTQSNITCIHNILDDLKQAKIKYPKYGFIYSNLSFDLWILLHKGNLSASFTYVNNYLNSINTFFGTSFGSMDEYKKEKNFKKCLEGITLKNVKEALDRANLINKARNDNLCPIDNYKGFAFYKDNPSLTVQELIDKIFKKAFKKNNIFWAL